MSRWRPRASSPFDLFCFPVRFRRRQVHSHIYTRPDPVGSGGKSGRSEREKAGFTSRETGGGRKTEREREAQARFMYRMTTSLISSACIIMMAFLCTSYCIPCILVSTVFFPPAVLMLRKRDGVSCAVKPASEKEPRGEGGITRCGGNKGHPIHAIQL